MRDDHPAVPMPGTTSPTNNDAHSALDAAGAQLRQRMSDLSVAIDDLRREADRLGSISSRYQPAIGLLEHPEPMDVGLTPQRDTEQSPLHGPDAAAPDTPAELAADVADLADITEPADAEAPVSSSPGLLDAVVEATTALEENTTETPAPAAPERDTESRDRGVHDGLDAISSSESTRVPADWDAGSDDAEAFDTFFSDDVEPEPAQRWLLDS